MAFIHYCQSVPDKTNLFKQQEFSRANEGVLVHDMVGSVFGSAVVPDEDCDCNVQHHLGNLPASTVQLSSGAYILVWLLYIAVATGQTSISFMKIFFCNVNEGFSVIPQLVHMEGVERVHSCPLAGNLLFSNFSMA